MKIRNGFVSNSSSTAFLFTNKSKEHLTILDFIEENGGELVRMWNDEYYETNTLDELYESAEGHMQWEGELLTFKPGETREMVFGDEDGTVMGRIFDYILRYGGDTKNWKWKFSEWRR